MVRQAGLGTSLTAGRSWFNSYGRQVVVLVFYGRQVMVLILRQAGLATSLTAY